MNQYLSVRSKLMVVVTSPGATTARWDLKWENEAAGFVGSPPESQVHRGEIWPQSEHNGEKIDVKGRAETRRTLRCYCVKMTTADELTKTHKHNKYW